MAKYDITRSCGHEETVQIYGPVRERAGKERFEASKLCAGCYAAEQSARRQAEAAKAAGEADAAGLPALVGSEKQVAWALTIRARILAEAAKLEASVRANMAKTTVTRPLTPAERYWIDHKDDAAVEIVKALTKAAADAARRAA